MTSSAPQSIPLTNKLSLPIKAGRKPRNVDHSYLIAALWQFCRQYELPIDFLGNPDSMPSLIPDCLKIDNFLGIKFFHLLAKTLPIPKIDMSPDKILEPSLIGTAEAFHLGPQLPLLEIALLYEQCLDTAVGKREGVFLTPLPVVTRMVSELFQSISSKITSNSPTFLDPAVGSGVFLIEALRVLFSLNKSPPEHIIKNCLFGIDKEPLAVEATKLFLNLASLELWPPSKRSSFKPIDLSSNIVQGNALLDEYDFNFAENDLKLALEARNWPEVFKSPFRQGGFDAVIGNPPYGLSRGQQLSSAENKKLQNVYESSRSGKVNKYLLFIARALKLVKPYGAISFIVPNAWLGIEAGRALRSKLLEDFSLSSVTSFRCKVFNQPSVEPVIITILPNRNCAHIALRALSSLELNDAGTTDYIPRSICIKTSDRTIPLSWSDSTQSIFDAIQVCSNPLEEIADVFTPKIAIQAYAAGKGTPPQTQDDVANHIFDYDAYQDESSIRYLDGSDVEQYKFTWRNKFLKYGPWLAEPQRIDRFEQPRIAIREILAPPPYRLIACPITETFLYNKSVLHILTAPRLNRITAEQYAWALSALLNSKLGSFWISNKGKKSQRRLFPKLVLSDLNEFPIPNSFLSKAATLSKLAQHAFDPEGLSAIDNAVFEAFALSAQHIKLIEDNLEGWRATLNLKTSRKRI